MDTPGARLVDAPHFASGTLASGDQERRARSFRDLAYDFLADSMGAEPPAELGVIEDEDDQRLRKQRHRELVTRFNGLLQDVISGSRVVAKAASGAAVAWLVSWSLGPSVPRLGWPGPAFSTMCGAIVWGGWLVRAARRRGWRPLRRVRNVPARTFHRRPLDHPVSDEATSIG
jgi:hypothetical protein